uniref:NB-ARC domain-containing protein n=1 Tax=Salix viminalis TaxID=40686 RepID=A0A6N2LVZ8_SALVM
MEAAHWMIMAQAITRSLMQFRLQHSVEDWMASISADEPRGDPSQSTNDQLCSPLVNNDVGIPVPLKGCKLILTTRSEAVCRQMDSKNNVKVYPLSNEEAWRLFMEELGHDLIDILFLHKWNNLHEISKGR